MLLRNRGLGRLGRGVNEPPVTLLTQRITISMLHVAGTSRSFYKWGSEFL